MRELENLTWKTFHRLTVIEFLRKDKKKWNMWKCVCKCGNEVIRSTWHLHENVQHSCWCRWWIYHHQTWTHFYRKYQEAKKRCNNNKCDSYKYYWWKWVKFERNSFEEFKNDMYNSYIDHVKKHGENNTSLDRIDSNWNYCKENCRWATREVQNLNRSNMKWVYYKWIKMSFARLERELWIHHGGIKSKISRWVPLERIISHPHERYYKHDRYKIKSC